MKRRIKILKPVQSYTIGKNYRVSPHFANKLIGRGQASLVPDVKQEKAVIVTKEEKFIPITKIENEGLPKEVLSISKLKKVITDLSSEELMFIANNDQRVSAVSMAKKELSKR